MTLANRLTLVRALMVIPYAAFALEGERLVAGVLFALAAVTDLLDGYVARSRKEETALGRVLDPIADKMLTITALIVLVAMDTLTGWPMVAVIVIAMRELWVAGLREGLIEGGAELPVSAMSKGKTTVQLLALFLLTLGDSVVGYSLLWAAAVLTVITGFQYTAVAFKVFSLETEEPPKPR